MLVIPVCRIAGVVVAVAAVVAAVVAVGEVAECALRGRRGMAVSAWVNVLRGRSGMAVSVSIRAPLRGRSSMVCADAPRDKRGMERVASPRSVSRSTSVRVMPSTSEVPTAASLCRKVVV